MVSAHSQPRTTLRYVADLPLYDKEDLYELHMDDVDIPPDTPRTNVEWQPYSKIQLSDMRRSTDLGLDTTGFLWTSHISKNLPQFQPVNERKRLVTADQKLISAYIQETADLVKQLTTSDSVIVWDWRYRSGTIEQAYAIDPTSGINSTTAIDRMEAVQLATNVHLDISQSGASRRLTSILSEDELTKYSSPEWRIRMINVWRPLVPVIRNGALALCDMRSVQKRDILTVDKVFRTYINQTAYLKFNPGHAWYYLADQTMNEPLIFSTYDSQRQHECAGPPHAACNINPAEPTFIRESIEVRLVAIERTD